MPFQPTKSGPHKLRADSAPSDFVTLISVSKMEPIWGPRIMTSTLFFCRFPAIVELLKMQLASADCIQKSNPATTSTTTSTYNNEYDNEYNYEYDYEYDYEYEYDYDYEYT